MKNIVSILKNITIVVNEKETFTRFYKLMPHILDILKMKPYQIGTLKELGAEEIPVGIGSDMIDAEDKAYEFDVPYMATEEEVHPAGVDMFAKRDHYLSEGSVCIQRQGFVEFSDAFF